MRRVPIFFRSIEGVEPAAVAAIVEGVHGEAGTGKPGAWKPWFPVIDYGRCTNCMQCLTFCLFDVYGVTADRKIKVQNRQLQDGLPGVLARLSGGRDPVSQVQDGPINGDEVREEDIQREAMKVDISALLGGDIYEALRTERDAKSAVLEGARRQARLKERQRCLTSSAEIDIPPEVLASLPAGSRYARKPSGRRRRRSLPPRAGRRHVMSTGGRHVMMAPQFAKRMIPRPTRGCCGSSATISDTRACGRCSVQETAQAGEHPRRSCSSRSSTVQPAVPGLLGGRGRSAAHFDEAS